MTRSQWVTGATLAAVLGAAATPASALTTIQQCGQQYQAAKAAGTLNGMAWPQFRSDCTAKLKAEPAAVVAAPPVGGAVTTEPPPANPLKPAVPAVAVTPPTVAQPVLPVAPVAVPAGPVAAPAATKAGAASPGRQAMLTRERQCGAEWRAQKVDLVAKTPGLTWPKYWSACNTRLKAAGQ